MLVTLNPLVVPLVAEINVGYKAVAVVVSLVTVKPEVIVVHVGAAEEPA